MSYRKTSIKTKIHRIKPKKSIFRRLWFWIMILIAVIFACTIYFSLFYSGIQIENIVISGNQKISAQEIETIATENIKITILKIKSWEISSKSIFLIDKNKIENNILAKFPGIEGVTIKRKLPHIVTININERKPLGAFCDNNNKCYSIDANGVIFELSEAITPETIIVRQIADPGQISAGQEILAQNIILAIYKVQTNLKDGFGVGLKEVIIANSERLNMTTSEGWKIYFDLSDNYDADVQIKKLNLLLSGEVSAEKRKDLRYVDLRPNDRAIVCDNSTCGG